MTRCDVVDLPRFVLQYESTFAFNTTRLPFKHNAKSSTGYGAHEGNHVSPIILCSNFPDRGPKAGGASKEHRVLCSWNMRTRDQSTQQERGAQLSGVGVEEGI